MTTAEVATQLVTLCREGRFLDAVKTLYADDIVSVEAVDYQGLGREIHGKEAVLAKNVAWFNDNDVRKVICRRTPTPSILSSWPLLCPSDQRWLGLSQWIWP